MSIVGNIEPYIPNKGETWSLYLERVEIFFKANTITQNDRKLNILLTVMGSQNYKLLRNSLYPAKPETTSWKVVNEHLKKIHEPSVHFMVERAKFLERVQLQGEPMSTFMAELKGLAEYCKFDNLDQALVSQTIAGMRDSNLRAKILQIDNEDELNFKAIEKKACAYEAARRNANSFQKPSSSDSGAVYKVAHRFQHHHQQQSTQQQKQQAGGAARGGHKPGHGFRGPHKHNSQTGEAIYCFRCGGSHKANVCSHMKSICIFCKKEGHIKKVCFKFKKQAGRTHYVEEEPQVQQPLPQQEFEGAFDNLALYHMSQVSEDEEEDVLPPIILPLLIDNKYVNMEVDSGAASSIIGIDTYNKLWPEGLQLYDIDRNLHTWSKELLQVKGCATVKVELNGKIHKLPLIIMFKAGPCFLGRNWFTALQINIVQENKEMCGNISSTVCNNKATHAIPREIHDFNDVFSPGLGRYTGPPVSIELKEGTNPVFRPARQVPYARQKKAEETIEGHIKDGYMSPTKFSEFGTPVLFVTCSDGTLRMVGDYSGTVNPLCKVDIFPMPTVDSVLDNLSGGCYFTKLDLKRAFNQITVDDRSAEILTLNTSKGLFKVHRLSPGLSVAPAIFQRTMTGIMAGLQGVITYFDDVLIQGKTKQELWARTREVLQRLREFGLKLNLSKCVFCVTELDFIGYNISGTGVKPTDEKVSSLIKMPHPKDKPELQSFLGYVNYYDRFLRNKAAIFHPLYQLLHDGVEWQWSCKEKNAVEYVKKIMTSDIVLTPYNPQYPIVLAVDASPVGLGYVISHIMPDGLEKPIAFASRTLQAAEKNYSQLDKEALAIVCGVKKFNKYLSGREFTILTDHKPLLGIFRPDKSIPEMLSPRLIRWCLLMGGYQYKLLYRPGKLNGNADCLSRLPVPATREDESQELRGILLLEMAPEGSPISSEKIADLTRKDQVLSRVLHLLLHGGKSEEMPEEFKRRYAGLSISHKCILYGDRVVIPACLHKQILQLLHKNHVGMVKMKSVARSYVFWPNIDNDIENLVKSCTVCAAMAKDPPKVPVMPWFAPQAPWSRLHIDFAGPYKNKTLLIIVDAYSKWIEVFDSNHSMSTSIVIKHLRNIFAVHGICDQICSDNGPAFCSAEFKEFCENNLINHMLQLQIIKQLQMGRQREQFKQ
jgi:hypothetical protein